MALRIAASLDRRVDRLAGVARAKRLSVPGGVVLFGTDELDAQAERLFAELAALPHAERGGYLLVPPILSVDEWEALALDSQEKLASDTSDWLGPPPVVNAPDPADVSDLYKPNPATVQR